MVKYTGSFNQPVHMDKTANTTSFLATMVTVSSNQATMVTVSSSPATMVTVNSCPAVRVNINFIYKYRIMHGVLKYTKLF